MRVLFASLASVGHTYPLIPLAIAARDAGHEVHFAAGPEVHAPLAANGLRPFRPGDAFYEVYAEDLAPELARLRPDLVVHEWGLPGAAVAAHRAGIPGLWHGFGRMFPEGIGLELPTRNAEVVGRPHLRHLAALAAGQGLPRHRTSDRAATGGLLDTGPAARTGEPSDVPAVDLSDPRHRVRHAGAAAHRHRRPGDAGRRGGGRGGPGATGTTGRDPDHVSVHQWVSQAELLPLVDVVVHHGGSGTTLGALAAGVPQLLLPQGADQFANADTLAAAGVAVRLLPGEVDADAVAEQAHRLLPQRGNVEQRDAARAGRRGDRRACPRRRPSLGLLPEYAA